MKYSIYLVLLLLCLSCSHRPVQDITSVSYRGWERCIKLSNKVVSIIVNPTYGGQILYLGLDSRGENILWSDSVINGWTVADYTRTRRSPDAGRFDIGNERKTEHIHDSIWAGPYQVFVEDDRLRLVSYPSQAMGIQVERIYSLEDGRPVLHINQRMKNVSNRIVEYCFWTRTLLPAGGIYFSEAVSDAQYPAGYSEISLVADTLLPSSVLQERVCLNNSLFTAYPGGDREQKYGINTMSGTYYYQFRDYLYIKQNNYIFHGKYDNNNEVRFPNMIYFNSQFIEMEPNSPMIKLKPGEVYEYQEVWTLMDFKANSVEQIRR